MCVHTGCALHTPVCMHARYTVFSHRTQITHQKYPNLSTTIAVNLTAYNLNTTQPTPKPPPPYRHTFTQYTGIYITNNLIHPPTHTSNFYFLKTRTSPSCQIFNQAWGHIKQQLPLTGSMCVHTGCAPRTPACTHTCYTFFSQKTQRIHQQHPTTYTTITVNLTAYNINTPQPTPKPPPLYRHTCTQGTSMHAKLNTFFNNLIHPPHTSNFYYLKSGTSPSCQIFNQAWGHIKQQLPPTGGMCVHTGCVLCMPVCMHARYSVFSQNTRTKHQKYPNLNTTIAVNLIAYNLNTPQPTPKPPPP